MENLEDLVLKFDCNIGTLPSSYLGVSLGASFKSVTTWDGMRRDFFAKD